MDSGLQVEWDRLLDEYEAASEEDAQKGSLAKSAAREVAEKLDAIRDRVKASEVTFEFDKSRLEWQAVIALQAAHPPRDGNLMDKVRGFNTETYFPALIRAVCRSVTGADGDSATDVPDDVWDGLLGRPATEDTPAVAGTLNLRQVNLLATTAEQAVNGVTTVPPSARSLHESPDSGASLAQPGPGTSHPDGSEDGNPPGSTTTSTTKKARTKAGSNAS